MQAFARTWLPAQPASSQASNELKTKGVAAIFWGRFWQRKCFMWGEPSRYDSSQAEAEEFARATHGRIAKSSRWAKTERWNTMKTIFLISLLLLLGVGAFGQCCQSSMAAPAMTSAWTAPDHSQRAMRHGLATEYDLREIGGVTMARGELPAWEVMSPAEETPLGDVARDYRKEHETAKKARIVWEQVGN